MTSNDNSQIDDTQIDLPDAWDGDKLNRKAEGEFLANYLINKFTVETAEHSRNFTLNINADWGFGKTYFLKNLSIDLENRKHKTVYFDAWKNDFSDKPMLGFISEINDALSSFLVNDESKLEAVKKGFIARFSKLKNSAAPLMAGFLAKQLVGASFEQIEDLFDDECEEISNDTKDSNNLEKDVAKTVSSITTKAAEFALKEHINTKNSIEQFKVNLKDLVDYIKATTDFKLPLFILVDELDRCRPSYAIELLETIKHLFDVEGVYFIVATATNQLSHSVNAVYGENFESKRYLNRFFDQEYQLIQPKKLTYCTYLFNKEIKDSSKLRIVLPLDIYKRQSSTNNENAILIDLIARYTNAGLRDIEQAVKLIQAINLTSNKNFYSILIIFLIFCKIRHPNIYPKICTLWGNKSWDKDKFQLIQDNFNLDIKFIYSNKNQPSSTNPNEIDILELIINIIGLDGQSCHEILTTRSNTDFEYLIVEDYVENNESNNRLIDFAYYPTVVNQVGQLM